MWPSRIYLQDLNVFICHSENIYSTVSLVAKNLSTCVQSVLQDFIGWPCSQETCILINKINMHSQHKTGAPRATPARL